MKETLNRIKAEALEAIASPETDAPYLAPVPYRGKINNSILMQETCAVVAQVHRIGADEMAQITYENACQLFGING